MRWVLMVGLVAMVGCGTQAIPDDGTADDASDQRLEVNDRLRAACPTWTDAQLSTGLSLVEADRLDGVSYQDEIDVTVAACMGPYGMDTDCVTCGVAVVDQIYGR